MHEHNRQDVTAGAAEDETGWAILAGTRLGCVCAETRWAIKTQQRMTALSRFLFFLLSPNFF
jgi:hypothetical protein